MFRGIYIAGSSTDSIQRTIDVLANNITNINTTGYKRDIVANKNIPEFPQILLSITGKNATLADSNLGDKGIQFEDVKGTYSAITDKGFFNVQTEKGVYNNRNILFNVNKDGFLATPQGNMILGKNGPINTGGLPITIDKSGNVSAGGAVIDKLKISDPKNVIGIISTDINKEAVFTMHDQGNMVATGDKYDFSIYGKGFFVVETPDGETYTRNGNWAKTLEGYLTTQDGHKIMGEKGYIKTDSGDFSVDSTGQVFKSDGTFIDKLKLVDFKDYTYLNKVTGNTFVVIDGATYEEQKKRFCGGSKTRNLRRIKCKLSL